MNKKLNPSLIFILGPTAVGKSVLAMKIANKLNGEILNADSMQVYSNLNILTARPSEKDCNSIPHHLYGYVDGSLRYNVANWCNDITKIIKKNNKNNIYSIIVGGTGMYIEKLLNGLIQIPPIPEKIKKESEQLILQSGLDKFINEIKKIDKRALNNISLNDTSRLRRIWEVYRHTKKPISYWLSNENKNYLINTKYKLFLFTPTREEIYNQVNKRFTKMIYSGAIEEVKELISLNLDKSLPIMKAHGVPEISSYLSGACTLNQCILKTQQVTRNYVKRQLTWWRSSTLNIHKRFDQFPSDIEVKSLNF